MERAYRKRSYPAKKAIQKDRDLIETIKHSDDIPLPNKREDSSQNNNEDLSRQKPSILDFIKKHIRLEEIIIIGLIFILLDEGIDDEFLLIILVYILIT